MIFLDISSLKLLPFFVYFFPFRRFCLNIFLLA